MLSRWSIRNKLLACVTMLLIAVVILAFVGFRGAYSYRELVRTISQRGVELPLSANLSDSAKELRYTFQQIDINTSWPIAPAFADDTQQQFTSNLYQVQDDLATYEQQLEFTLADPHIGDRHQEREAVAKIKHSIATISRWNKTQEWMSKSESHAEMEAEIDRLAELSSQTFLQERMQTLVDDVKVQYRTWIILCWSSLIAIVLLFGVMIKLVYDWIFQPIKVLVDGSRKVADGDYAHRVKLRNEDELAELAHGINDMTTKFEEIRDDLDAQVKERTNEVVRSEQLASVGFLAAGVAHEINNPLASIAWCAESLESRLNERIEEDQDIAEHRGEEYVADETFAVLQNYLRKIQSEAFRCKGITEKLLDFSRSADVERHSSDIRVLVQDVIDMVQHLGKYREKTLELRCHQHVIAEVNEQEIKQVILNLITNALDSCEQGGAVTIHLVSARGNAELLVEDDGCGMTDEVLEHLFEPFYTNRRDGQGTGLGLSITYRIVTEHGGRIEACSQGPGCGSQFRVTLPVVHHEEAIQQEQVA